MQRASNIAAALAIGLVVIGLGGVHTVVVGAAALVAIVAASLQIGHLRSREHRVLISLVGLSLLLAGLLCVAQLIPLPAFMHSLLNPMGRELYDVGSSLAGLTSDAWRPLSLDPGETADRALRYIALAAMAIWAANLRGRRRWQAFAYGFVPLALTVLAAGYVLWASGAKSFFGVYSPTVGFRGPSLFISTNHGALFYGLAMLVGAAAAMRLRHDHPRRAAGMAAASLVLGGAAVAMDSDGVLIALLVAGALAALMQWFRRGRPRQVGRDVWLGVVLLAVLGAIAAVWLDLHHVVGSIFSRALLTGEHGGRLALMQAGGAALGDFWRFGAGAGSVESVLPAYVDWSAVVAASIPVIENDPLEVMLSFGVPFGLLIIAAPLVQIALIARHGVDGKRSPRYAVAVVAGTYLAIVAQLHFPLFALGISLPAVVWFELLWSRRMRPSGQRRVFTTGHVAVSWQVALGSCVGLAVLALFAANARFSTYAAAEQLDAAAEYARELTLRPASHAPYVKLATAAVRAGDLERAVKLADHAVTREPSPRVRLYRAQILSRAGDPRGPEAFAALFDEGHKRGRYVQRLLTSIESADQRADLLARHPDMWVDAVQRIQQLDGPDAVSSFVVSLAELHPNDVAVYRLGAVVYLRLGQPVLSELWAELAHDLESTQNTPQAEAPLLLARALRASGKIDEARAVLEEAAKNPALVHEAHRVALELRGTPNPDLQDFVKGHHDAYCVSPIPAKDQRICWSSEGWLLEAVGDHEAAARVYRRMQRRMDDPLPLAQYYQRNARCEDLLTLSRELDPGPKRRAVEALRSKCAQ